MSPAQVTFGAVGLKFRATRSRAGTAALSGVVVLKPRRGDSPTQPLIRMIRATRLRLTWNSWRRNQRCTRGEPYVRPEVSQIAFDLRRQRRVRSEEHTSELQS